MPRAAAPGRTRCYKPAKERSGANVRIDRSVSNAYFGAHPCMWNVTEEDEMTVREIMTASPATCTENTRLNEIARMMHQHDCGAIPVVGADGQTQRPIGVVTDRDIVIRCLAEDKNPEDCTAQDVMTGSPVTVRMDASVEECTRLMEEHQIRRLVVVDDDGKIAGICAQADIARHASQDTTGRVVAEVSQPNT
jgi:CBS domain-containing protein